jgi:hypothetical protein
MCNCNSVSQTIFQLAPAEEGAQHTQSGSEWSEHNQSPKTHPGVRG